MPLQEILNREGTDIVKITFNEPIDDDNRSRNQMSASRRSTLDNRQLVILDRSSNAKQPMIFTMASSPADKRSPRETLDNPYAEMEHQDQMNTSVNSRKRDRSLNAYLKG